METTDFLIIYPWITKDFFKNILQKMQINNYISVEHFSLKPALAKGENYGSQMIRANITYYINTNNLKHEHISLLIKTELPQNEKIESELNLLLKEITVYKSFLPRMHKLLREINDDTNFSPICLDCGLNPSYMVLEDLTLSGYQNIDRKSGLNYEHFKILLTKVAKWHATSSVIGIKNPELLKYYKKPLLNAEYSTDFQILLKNCISTCHQIISGWPGYEKISEKLIVLQTTFLNKCCDVFSSDVNDFNVLNHGDLWSNNLLFKLNGNEEILDVILVDYSIGFWGLPGIDLSYTFFTSSNIANVQENEWDNLTQHYYSVLIKTLKDLNYPKKMPTLIDINVSILRKGIYSVIMSMLMIGARKLKEENVDISLFTGETAKDQELREKILNDPSCKPVLKYVIDYCNRKGFFD